MKHRAKRAWWWPALTVVAMVATVACGDSNDGDLAEEGAERPEPAATTVRLLTHDSFNVSDSVIERFEDDTGIRVEILRGGDANEVVNRAVLTKDRPEADVLFGIDNSMLGRAFDEDLFVSHESPALANVDAAFQLDPEHRVTPIDFGDVCLNYDREHFVGEGLAVPETLEQLADPAYRDLLVVQDPSSSSPGLAFLLATVDVFGEDGWQDFWRDLRANGVSVSDGWEQAYYDLFSGGSGGGDRPLVVSYASSPPAEVDDPASTPPDESPTGVVPASCYRQIEFAGILAGSDNQEAAAALIDHMLSVPFQEDVPEQMYVYPVNREAALPEVFTTYSVVVDDPLQLDAEVVAANRDRWIEEWTRLFR
jgi:thiamine transport system substrate-binding protein